MVKTVKTWSVKHEAQTKKKVLHLQILAVAIVDPPPLQYS